MEISEASVSYARHKKLAFLKLQIRKKEREGENGLFRHWLRNCVVKNLEKGSKIVNNI